MSDQKQLAEELRRQILELVGQYADLAHAPAPFVAGTSSVPVSGKVYGASEMQSLVDAALDFWLTTGRFNAEFESRLAGFTGHKHALTVNSGSSANLVAVSALTSHLMGDRQLKPGDEVITCATGFPTTVNPILQNNLKPVFVDVDIPTYNIDVSALEAAVSGRTRAIVIAHTLGNPFNVDAVLQLARKHDLFVIEDCCDALGATYRGEPVGTFGEIGTLSFYPAHHITMGEGGAVLTNNGRTRRIMESIRDWGRDCWCAPGHDGTCKQRFGWQLGDLPFGYDHKYTYSHLGYNLKITDLQAAVALAQLDRLPGFIADRRRNFALLQEGLRDLQDIFILPEATPHSEPSWFGFPLTLRPGLDFTREELLEYLNARKIATRLLFGGNLIRQPYMIGRDFRAAGPLDRSDVVMTRTFWLGVYPALSQDHIAYVIDSLRDFCLHPPRGTASAVSGRVVSSMSTP
ncbi:Lipopolysaccharide biosynthesis protein rfbH [Bradyrhizobium sp. STM 3843]|uniref:lipopolysaccharide biosynthesis protein RfbH n=1 Tax=Bradyrhizobium sp. STM 3843 TaxID=551947 RepID=UPI00024066A3|nr:lipopolysaccharide biosynthesis protein RfbH [Bradyrhizobium sp. STM 3843]CCE04767.1 Lipopolysaccharide biosynthesis protein rfbH [Bradyrhizobium sp. STM 3843]